MSSIRLARPLRLTALRAPIMFTRHYAPDVRPEGSTGSSEGFGKREQAEEGQYIKKRELERLKQAQEKLKAAQDEVEQQQAKVDKAK